MEPLSLHFVHEEARARFTGVGGREVVAAYGDPEAEYRAAREAVAVHDASYRECVRLTGEDRASFLHGMVTQDVKGLPAGASAYATMVTVKGAMVADARLVRREQDLLLDVEPGAGARVREFLDKYLISEDAELHDASAELALLRLLGPRTPELLGRLAGDAAAQPLAPGASRTATLAGQPLLLLAPPAVGGFGVPGVDLLLPREGLQAVWSALTGAGAAPLGYEALELLRVEAGTPRFGQDLVETTIPLEANLAHAISYNKGCYIGQEVIARATFRGHMNRTLAGFLLGDAQAAAGTDLMREGKRVGWLTSVVKSPRLGQWVALGYVRREVEPGTALQLGEGPHSATVQPLPFPASR